MLFGNIHTQNTRFLRTVNYLFPTSHFLHSDNNRLHSIHVSSEYIVSTLFAIRYLIRMISRCHVLVLDFTCYLPKTTTHDTFTSNQLKRNKTPKGVNAGDDCVTLRYGSISHTRNYFAITSWRGLI